MRQWFLLQHCTMSSRDIYVTHTPLGGSYSVIMVNAMSCIAVRQPHSHRTGGYCPQPLCLTLGNIQIGGSGCIECTDTSIMACSADASIAAAILTCIEASVALALLRRWFYVGSTADHIVCTMHIINVHVSAQAAAQAQL
jgi:hypothetical protein